MRTYENVLLRQGIPIPILPREMTPDVRITSATKDGLPYPVDKALIEVKLRRSSKAYRALLKRDYAGLRGYEGLEDTVYVLYTDSMRTLTILHRSPNRSDGGKFWVDGALNPYHRPFHGSGITFAMLDRLRSAQQDQVA